MCGKCGLEDEDECCSTRERCEIHEHPNVHSRMIRQKDGRISVIRCGHHRHRMVNGTESMNDVCVRREVWVTEANAEEYVAKVGGNEVEGRRLGSNRIRMKRRHLNETMEIWNRADIHRIRISKVGEKRQVCGGQEGEGRTEEDDVMRGRGEEIGVVVEASESVHRRVGISRSNEGRELPGIGRIGMRTATTDKKRMSEALVKCKEGINLIQKSRESNASNLVEEWSHDNGREFVCLQNIRVKFDREEHGELRVALMYVIYMITYRPLRLVSVNLRLDRNGEEGLCVYCSCCVRVIDGLPQEGFCWHVEAVREEKYLVVQIRTTLEKMEETMATCEEFEEREWWTEEEGMENCLVVSEVKKLRGVRGKEGRRSIAKMWKCWTVIDHNVMMFIPVTLKEKADWSIDRMCHLCRLDRRRVTMCSHLDEVNELLVKSASEDGQQADECGEEHGADLPDGGIRVKTLLECDGKEFDEKLSTIRIE